MFPFFKRRDEGPLAVEDAVFTPEDVFVLLGESPRSWVLRRAAQEPQPRPFQGRGFCGLARATG